MVLPNATSHTSTSPSTSNMSAYCDDVPAPTPMAVAAAPKWGPLLTAKEAAAYLRCDVSTVSDLVHAGRLKGISLTGNMDPRKRGRKALRVLASSVDELVTAALADQPAPPAKAEPEPVVVPSRRPVSKPSRAGRSRVMLPRPVQTS